MIFSSSPAIAIDTFSMVEGAVVALLFKHMNVRVHVLRTGMVKRSPVDVVTNRRFGAGCLPFLKLLLLFGAL